MDSKFLVHIETWHSYSSVSYCLEPGEPRSLTLYPHLVSDLVFISLLFSASVAGNIARKNSPERLILFVDVPDILHIIEGCKSLKCFVPVSGGSHLPRG